MEIVLLLIGTSYLATLLSKDNLIKQYLFLNEKDSVWYKLTLSQTYDKVGYEFNLPYVATFIIYVIGMCISIPTMLIQYILNRPRIMSFILTTGICIYNGQNVLNSVLFGVVGMFINKLIRHIK